MISYRVQKFLAIVVSALIVIGLLLLLMGCTLSTPVTHINNPAVYDMCETPGRYLYTHEGETKSVNVHFVTRENMSLYCDKPHWAHHSPIACTNRYDIWVTPSVNCPKSMAHELSHVFGMDHIDHVGRR